MRKANDWNQPCPNKSCDRHGQKNQGNIISISTYMTKSGKRKAADFSVRRMRGDVFGDA